MRNAFLLLCAVLAVYFATTAFRHDPAKKNWTLAATNAVFIATPCAKSVTIVPNDGQAPANQLQISAAADDKSEINQLQTTGGASALISGAGSHCLGASACVESSAVCAGQPDDPTLTLTIGVPAGIAINITEAAGTEYAIGTIDGPLTLNLSGSGDVDAAGATTLTANLTGSGDARISSVTGNVTATLSGRGDLDIGHLAAAATALTLNGDGDVNIASGSAGTLTATLSQSGDLHIPAASNAKLLLTADGDVTIGQIAGDLDATLTGDGDLTAASVAGDAALNSSGDGDITIPHLTGHLTQSNTGDGDIKINGS